MACYDLNLTSHFLREPGFESQFCRIKDRIRGLNFCFLLILNLYLVIVWPGDLIFALSISSLRCASTVGSVL